MVVDLFSFFALHTLAAMTLDIYMPRKKYYLGAQAEK
jgi:hypothetical protein